MTNPYEVLGVNQYATDEEIKKAYREKARMYAGNPDMLNELDIAYDSIVMSGGNVNNSGYYSYDDLSDIKSIDDAETLLDGIPVGNRTAEWYYLKGTIQKKRGWLESAAESFQRAYEYEPSNSTYRNAYESMNRSRKGNFGTHKESSDNSGCLDSPCRLCSGLLCADCCCECFGGDLIRCC